LAWYRKLVARKIDGSKARRSLGRPRIKREVEQLIVRMAKENRDWGYDRIAGALANLGYEVCDQTVGNVLQRHGLPPAPERKRTTTWSAFIRIHLALLAGTDFFTAEVLTLHGLVTYYVLFFIHLESRRVDIAGVTVHPDERWMRQIARNMTMEGYGALRDCRYLLHDRDTKYTQSFRAIIASGGVEPLVLPARSPNLTWGFRCQEVFSVAPPFWFRALSSITCCDSIESSGRTLTGRSAGRSEGARRRAPCDAAT